MQEKTKKNEAYELHEKHGNFMVAEMLQSMGLDNDFVRAEGCTLTDSQGNQFTDFCGGFGCHNIGHNHPDVMQAKIDFILRREPNMHQTALNIYSGRLLKKLSELTNHELSRGFLCSTGTEAVEAAIKLVVLATKKPIIIATTNSFHGKTLGSLSLTGREKFRKGLEGWLSPQVIHIPYNDLSALEKSLAANQGKVAAFIVEPIQGEGGVNIPDEGYLSGAKKLCHKYKSLLVLDEIQTGLGRTGKMFAYQHEEDATPDVLCLSKSLGGGYTPIGAIMTRHNIWKKAYGSKKNALMHSSTFGGNAEAAVTALATIKVIEGDGYSKSLCDKAHKMGTELMKYLVQLKNNYPNVIADVRGKGLLIGIELKPLESMTGLAGHQMEDGAGQIVMMRLHKEYCILTAFTMNNPNVIRVEPPLILSRADTNYFVHAMSKISQTYNESLDKIFVQ